MKNKGLKSCLKVLLVIISVGSLLVVLNNTYNEVYSFVDFIKGLLVVLLCSGVLTLVAGCWVYE